MSLSENGGKFIHYYFRDVVKMYLQYIGKGYKPENVLEVSQLIGKIIRTLPHDNSMIYSDNIDILEGLLKIEGVYVERKLITEMLKTKGN